LITIIRNDKETTDEAILRTLQYYVGSLYEDGTSSYRLEGVGVISIVDRSNGLLRWHVCRRDIAYRSSPILSALGILYDGSSEMIPARTCVFQLRRTKNCSVRISGSRTIGKDQVVDELTHDTEIEYMLSGVAPTGRYVEIPHVVEI
jgi:hypothetical protein